MQYGLNRAMLDEVGKDIVIMHPGPINRGVEMSPDVADGERSVIMEQVTNGVVRRGVKSWVPRVVPLPLAINGIAPRIVAIVDGS